MSERELLLIRVSKVTSNNDEPMVYIPRRAREISGIKRGDFVFVYVDDKGRIIIEKLKHEDLE